jgi:GNAT superfamily N-acetyltransferase
MVTLVSWFGGHTEVMDGFELYLESLVGSWEALIVPHPSARVVSGDGFVGCRHPNVVFNNALLLAADAVGRAQRFFVGAGSFALWCRVDDVETAVALAAAGFRRDVTTCAMRCELSQVELPSSSVRVLCDVDLARIAELNALPGDVLAGVPSARGCATAGLEAGLVLIAVGTDVNVSFVATRPNARRRGLATAVVAAALRDADRSGVVTATLQATPMAQRLYANLGFAPVAQIQEWVIT